jgi:hypothetical protein
MKEYICKEVPTENGGYIEIESELIRCMDCKYNDAQQYVDCTLMPQMFGKTVDNNFCSYAEPKETES